MFQAKTVFVVGAGTSVEVGLPTGEKLKSEIAEHLDMRFDDFGERQISGDIHLFNALDKHVGRNLVNNYLRSAWQLRDALPQAISIDNLLDAHSGDAMAELCGKLGIVRSILAAEKESSIYLDGTRDAKINFASLEGTWFSGFMKILTERRAKSNIGSLFDNVSFINFNYDRCIEHYLFHALQGYYGINGPQAAECLKRLNIYRPYGKVGALPWQNDNQNQAIPFGHERADLIFLSQQIKTFFESVSENEEMNSISEEIQSADIIVFLGFAFHRQNIDLLFRGNSCRAKKIYATALGISGSDCDTIKSDLIKGLNQRDTTPDIYLRNDLKSGHFFKEYQRSITAG